MGCGPSPLQANETQVFTSPLKRNTRERTSRSTQRSQARVRQEVSCLPTEQRQRQLAIRPPIPSVEYQSLCDAVATAWNGIDITPVLSARRALIEYCEKVRGERT